MTPRFAVIFYFYIKVFSWNIRDTNDHAKRRRLKEVIVESNLDWIGL